MIDNTNSNIDKVSVHPQIKSGDLFVAHISDMYVDGELIEKGVDDNGRKFYKIFLHRIIIVLHPTRLILHPMR